MDSVISRKIHTVIFDLDGTLSDSALLTMEALRTAAPAFGLAVPDEKTVKLAMGYANPEFYDRLFPDAPRDTVRKLGNMVEREELRILPHMGERLLFDGCRALLEQLKSGGIRLYIASTGDHDHVFSVLRVTGIIDLFDNISCGLPDKTEMLRAMTSDMDKNGYVMVGDMKKDSDGARANGILSAGACYGYCLRESAEFDVYLDNPFTLLELINIVDS